MSWNRIWYGDMLAPDGGSTGGTPPAGAGATNTPPPGAGGTPPGTGATEPPVTPPTEPPATPPATPPGGRTLTQEEFDRALAARLKKYADYDTLKAAADKLKTIEDAQKSELDKEREKAAQAVARAKQLEEQARESSLRGAVIAEAAKQGFADPMDAYRLLDIAKIELQEDGTVKGLTDALSALATAKPYLRNKTTPPVPPTNPPRDSGSQKRTDDDRRRDYFGGGRSDFWNPEAKT